MYGVCVTGPDTIIASKDNLEVQIEGNPPCNAEDNLRARLLVIEARFRGYRGNPGLRGPWASGLLSMGRTDGLRIHEGRRLHRVWIGLYLAWRQAWQPKIPSYVTDSL